MNPQFEGTAASVERMKIECRARAVVAGLWVCLALAAYGQTSMPPPERKGRFVSERASGTFEVKLSPQGEKDDDLGRYLIDKQFHGDLEGISRGQMLTAGNAAKGSGGYVAIEKISGTLGGRSGTFILQHSGTMTRGTPQLSVTVVPESGTGQLAGLAGTMTIKIDEGKHFYQFDYTLPEAH
jgi:hypothetical protein